PVRLLGETQRIEAALGRAPLERRQRWGPRPLDIDIILYGDETIDRPDLRVPHPESHQRRFVLQPLPDRDPSVRWRGRTAAEHLAALPPGQPTEREPDQGPGVDSGAYTCAPASDDASVRPLRTPGLDAMKLIHVDDPHGRAARLDLDGHGHRRGDF